MKQLLISLLFINSAIFPASAGRTPEERIQFPDSNIIVHILESSLVNYKREKERRDWLYISTSNFFDIAKELATKTLTENEAKEIIRMNTSYTMPYLQTKNYVLAVLSKYRIS